MDANGCKWHKSTFIHQIGCVFLFIALLDVFWSGYVFVPFFDTRRRLSWISSSKRLRKPRMSRWRRDWYAIGDGQTSWLPGTLTNIYKWLFQLDDSKSLYKKWLFHQTSIYKWLFGVPGIFVWMSIPPQVSGLKKNLFREKVSDHRLTLLSNCLPMLPLLKYIEKIVRVLSHWHLKFLDPPSNLRKSGPPNFKWGTGVLFFLLFGDQNWRSLAMMMMMMIIFIIIIINFDWLLY